MVKEICYWNLSFLIDDKLWRKEVKVLVGNCFLNIKNETLLSSQKNPFKTSTQINGRRNLSKNWNKIFLMISSSKVQLSEVLYLIIII